jgi:hypothetical protein
LLLTIENERIHHAGVDAELMEKGCNLAAMMGLVVKK